MTSISRQSFENVLTPLKHWSDGLDCLDFSASLSSTILDDSDIECPAGRVMHLNASGTLDRGGSGTQMPLFLKIGKNEGSVWDSGVSSVSAKTFWWTIDSTGIATCLVATGGFEVQSSEYVKTVDYAANDLLTANATGLLTNVNAVQYTNWICGVCSKHRGGDYESTAPIIPTGANADGVDVITFWTYFLPASA